MGRRKLRWYWAAPALFSCARVWHDDGPWWVVAMVVCGALLAAFGLWRHRNDPATPVPFQAKANWPGLPVQPPSGSWQRRAHLLNATMATNLAVLLLAALVAGSSRSPNRSEWAPYAVWDSFGALLFQALVYIPVWVRGQQLLRRELRLGYTTWRRPGEGAAARGPH